MEQSHLKTISPRTKARQNENIRPITSKRGFVKWDFVLTGRYRTGGEWLRRRRLTACSLQKQNGSMMPYFRVTASFSFYDVASKSAASLNSDLPQQIKRQEIAKCSGTVQQPRCNPIFYRRENDISESVALHFAIRWALAASNRYHTTGLDWPLCHCAVTQAPPGPFDFFFDNNGNNFSWPSALSVII